MTVKAADDHKPRVVRTDAGVLMILPDGTEYLYTDHEWKTLVFGVVTRPTIDVWLALEGM